MPNDSRNLTLAGTLAWPFDPFFRPTIGVFQGESLILTAPAFRVPMEHADGTVEWACAYKIRMPKPQDGTKLTITCLETGQVLNSPATSEPSLPADPPQKAEKHLRIDDILAIARNERPSWDASGFLDFLELSVIDQIQLLYIDILGRDVDQSGLLHYGSSIVEGHKSILEVRDELLASAEFRNRGLSPEEKAGGWIVWGGLKEARPFVVPSAYPDAFVPPELKRWAAAQSVFVSYIEVITSNGDLADHLSKIALGWHANYLARRKWLKAHSKIVKDLIHKVKRNQDQRFLLPPQQSHPLSFKGFLASLQRSEAAWESDPAPDGQRSTKPRISAEVVLLIRRHYPKLGAWLSNLLASLDRKH